jgi:hypothetical protein
MPEDESTPDFKRGRYLGLIVFLVAVVLGVGAVLALSGVFENKRRSTVEADEPDNKEGGCPCSCDRSKAMAAELRGLGGDTARRAIDKSLATIAEREEAGYVTEAMIAHRLRLLDLEREMRRAGTIPAALRPRLLPFGNTEPPGLREELRVVGDGRLRVGMQLIVHGQTTEWVVDRQKLLRACFLLSMQVQNTTDDDRVVKKPVILASAPFPISRWYVSGESGEPWDGALNARERKTIHVIGYVGEALSPNTTLEATIHFESSTFRATTRARSRWNQVEPTHASL